MTGWLIVNSFMDSAKFSELYALLLRSAEKVNIDLTLVQGWELSEIVGDGFAALPDFVLFWDKDVMLAHRLEDAGLRLFNSADAIDSCDDKAKTYRQLANGGVRIPRTIVAPKTFEGLGYRSNFAFLEKAADKLGLPLIIKESYGSFGQQVYLAHTLDEAKAIVERIGHKEFVMQEFVATSRGRDVRVNVVGDRVIASMLRYNDHDFRSNISGGGSMKPYSPSEAQQAAALAAVRALDLDFAGVDIMFGEEDEPIVCEVNSNPHFKSTLDCTGVNLADEIMRYIAEEMV